MIDSLEVVSCHMIFYQTSILQFSRKLVFPGTRVTVTTFTKKDFQYRRKFIIDCTLSKKLWNGLCCSNTKLMAFAISTQHLSYLCFYPALFGCQFPCNSLKSLLFFSNWTKIKVSAFSMLVSMLYELLMKNFKVWIYRKF